MRNRVPDSAISVFCIKMGQIFKASLPGGKEYPVLSDCTEQDAGHCEAVWFQSHLNKSNVAFIILKISTKI